jgi:Cys-tRNA(Pro) deacylase
LINRYVEAVVAAAKAEGLDVEPRSFPDGTKTAEDAARAIGVDVGQIVKSLVFSVDGTPTMALVRGDRRLDEAKLAAATGGLRVARMDAPAVREATGFSIGGVPPIGHSLPVYVDTSIAAYDQVWAAAGTGTHVFPISPADLFRVTHGKLCDLSPSEA